MKFNGQSPEAGPSSLPAYFGSRQEIVFLRPGMEMILGNFCLTEQMKFDFYSGDVCEFVFVLSGKFRHRFSGTDEGPDISPLSAALWLTPKRKGQHDCFPGSDICFVCVRVRRALLSEIAGDYLHQVPREFRCILENREDSLYYRFSKMTVPMQAAARQVLTRQKNRRQIFSNMFYYQNGKI